MKSKWKQSESIKTQLAKSNVFVEKESLALGKEKEIFYKLAAERINKNYTTILILNM